MHILVVKSSEMNLNVSVDRVAGEDNKAVEAVVGAAGSLRSARVAINSEDVKRGAVDTDKSIGGELQKTEGTRGVGGPLILVAALDRSRVASTGIATANCNGRSKERESEESNGGRTSVHFDC